MVMQIIQKLDSNQQGLNLYLKPYEIIVTSENSRLLEFKYYFYECNEQYLKLKKIKFYFGRDYHSAQRNFIEMLAGYSLLTYIMSNKYNGNILIDNQGHLIHIYSGFETAQFKMTSYYIELMDGFLEYKKSCIALLQNIELRNFHSFSQFNITEFKRQIQIVGQ